MRGRGLVAADDPAEVSPHLALVLVVVDGRPTSGPQVPHNGAVHGAISEVVLKRQRTVVLADTRHAGQDDIAGGRVRPEDEPATRPRAVAES